MTANQARAARATLQIERVSGVDEGRKRLTTLREMVALALGAAQTRKQDPRSTRG